MNKLNKLYYSVLLTFIAITDIEAKPLSYYIKNNAEIIIIGIVLLFIFFTGLILTLIYFNNIRKENIIKLYLNIENMWNSPSMIESRQKCADFISDDILHSPNPVDKERLKHSRMIVDFFNHLGLQVYNGIIDFSYVYNLLGQEILDFWDRKNYKLLVAYDKHKAYPSDINPWVGFEYLAELCEQQREYLRGRLWVPAYYPPATYQPLKEKIFTARTYDTHKPLNIILISASVLAIIAVAVFVVSYLVYMHYF